MTRNEISKIFFSLITNVNIKIKFIVVIQHHPLTFSPFLNSTLVIDIKLREILRLKYSFVLIFRHPYKCILSDDTTKDNTSSSNPFSTPWQFTAAIKTEESWKCDEEKTQKSNYVTYVSMFHSIILIYSPHGFTSSVVKVIFLVVKGANRWKMSFLLGKQFLFHYVTLYWILSEGQKLRGGKVENSFLEKSLTLKNLQFCCWVTRNFLSGIYLLLRKEELS